jgi:hypothetical protein
MVEAYHGMNADIMFMHKVILKVHKVLECSTISSINIHPLKL